MTGKSSSRGSADGIAFGTWHRLAERPKLVPEMERQMLGDALDVQCLRCGRVWPIGQLRVEWDHAYPDRRRGEWYVMCGDPACKGGGPGVNLLPMEQPESSKEPRPN